jgi:hypothetical protein
VSYPVLMFCALGLVFGGIEGVGSRYFFLRSRTRFQRYRRRRVSFSCFALPDSFSALTGASGPFIHVLRPRTHFRRYPGCRVPFSRFALPDSFSAVPRASGPVFLFCYLRLIFGGTERRVLFSRFARPDPFLAVRGASGPILMFCALGIVFGGAECVGSRFFVLFSRTRFLRCRGRRVPFSCFALSDSFSAVPRLSGPFSSFARPDSFSAEPGAS